MAIRRQADRWHLYLGHVWHSGWSILDVTDHQNQLHHSAFVEDLGRRMF